VGEHVSPGVVQEGPLSRLSGAELSADMPLGRDGIVVVGLEGGLSDRGGDHGVLALWNVSTTVRQAPRMWKGKTRVTRRIR
jgi:hypothetical protein